MVKRLILLAGMAMAFTFVMAQDNPYIVKTKGAKKSRTVVASSAQDDADDAEPLDFMGKNFRYYSLCDWYEGMRFMVIPEKYDLLISTFTDSVKRKEVSSASLNNHIMVYKGHEDLPYGRLHINFFCETDGRSYYYDVPSITFDSYCYSKAGVPTLAYLGDVDKARELLMGQYLLTRITKFRVDIDYYSNGYYEVTMPKNKVVKVVAVGVGTRSYPVKIIVEDEDGRQYYQNVAMSRTNSGRSDKYLIWENEGYLFTDAFDFTGAEMVVSRNVNDYLNQTVHTTMATTMSSKGAGKVRNVKVPRFTGFIIDEIKPVRNSEYYTLTLRETETRRIYYKEVTFSESVAMADGNKDDYFGTLFGTGEGQMLSTTKETRAAIREGRVIPGMTQEEVQLAVGEPVTTMKDSNGNDEWIYNRSNGVLLVVQFDSDGIVKKAGGRAGKPNSAGGTKVVTRRSASMLSGAQRLGANGLPVNK